MADNVVERGQNALGAIAERRRRATMYDGYVGKPDGSGGHTIFVPHHPGYIYVRLVDGMESSIAEAVNLGVMPDPAIKIEIERVNGLLVVRGPNAAHAAYVYGDNAPSAAVPPVIQTIETGSAAIISANQTEGGRLVTHGTDNAALGGLKARITPYRHRGGWWDGNTIITLTPTATSANHAWVMVGINTVSNTIVQALTTNRGLVAPLLESDWDAIIVANPDVDWRAAVDVANGATSIDVTKISGVPNRGETSVKHNRGATAAPGVGDDSADGYGVGSMWIDTTNDNAYVCKDSTAGAAVWERIGSRYSTANVSNPPTAAELASAFSGAANGVVGVLDDNGGGANVWLVAKSGSSWWYTAMTAAV